MSILSNVDMVKVPADLGFDSQKFPQFRGNQLETAKWVASSDKLLSLVEAPTGVGKSFLALAAHRLMGEPRAVYLVSTKQLQDQVVKDFGIPSLKGRNNYPCLHFPELFPEVTSEICKEYLGGDECMFEDSCPYLKDKRIALAAPICVLNYPLFLSEANYVGGFSKLNYLIADEIDTLEDHLMSFIGVKITPFLIKNFNLGYPHQKTKLSSWQEWVTKSSERLGSEIESIGPPQNLNPKRLKPYIRLKRAHGKFKFLSDELDENWVLEQEESKRGEPISLSFKPVRIGPYAPKSLWKHSSKFLGMSATIMGAQALAIDLGLHTWDVAHMELPSPFPIESRKVEYIPVANVTHKTKLEAYPKLVVAVNTILNRHKDDKVLIHAVSYEVRDYLLNYLRPKYHGLMSHERVDRTVILERFKSYNVPVALISPSMERGVDLPGDLCRVIIVTKVPYPNLGSPQVNKRLHGFSDGSLWYSRRAARSLVQMTGRATRSMEDWSISYILDEQFGHLVGRNGNVFPEWWRQAVKSGSLQEQQVVHQL